MKIQKKNGGGGRAGVTKLLLAGSLRVFSAHSSPVTDNLLFLNRQKRKKIIHDCTDRLPTAYLRNGHASDLVTTPGIGPFGCCLKSKL